jgi:hypothetical protein
MKALGFEYEIKTVMQFNQAEVHDLIWLALDHYDARCRDAAKPGPGAFLNELKNMLGRSKRTVSRPFTQGELQIIAKILESDRYMPLDKRKSLFGAMQFPVNQAIRANNEEYRRLNP